MVADDLFTCSVYDNASNGFELAANVASNLRRRRRRLSSDGRKFLALHSSVKRRLTADENEGEYTNGQDWSEARRAHRDGGADTRTDNQRQEDKDAPPQNWLLAFRNTSEQLRKRSGEIGRG